MRHLLDANALLALGLTEHSFHLRVVRWLQGDATTKPKQVATCSITELAFVRILSQTVHGFSMSDAKNLLSKLKEIQDLDFVFIPDDEGATNLPSWVSRSLQVTDGHLVALAKKHGAVLATLDEKIPGAFLIPKK